jgi:hypothetical protein
MAPSQSLSIVWGRTVVLPREGFFLEFRDHLFPASHGKTGKDRLFTNPDLFVSLPLPMLVAPRNDPESGTSVLLPFHETDGNLRPGEDGSKLNPGIEILAKINVYPLDVMRFLHGMVYLSDPDGDIKGMAGPDRIGAFDHG